tara:strand:+ start:1519 stop:2082 length:564 start_codon:yes stop_codon:yes gene_type:complete
MRIIAGKLKGSTLNEIKNKDTRPLRDMARENLFNLLIHSNKIKFEIKKSKILDLYAGTGSFGLECLSREADSVFFVEKSKNAVLILEKNIEKLKLQNNTKIFLNDVFSLIDKENIFQKQFDLIFCDPPFKNKNIKNLIELINSKKLSKENGIIILHREKNKKDDFPEYFKILEEKIYGVSKIVFGKI